MAAGRGLCGEGHAWLWALATVHIYMGRDRLGPPARMGVGTLRQRHRPDRDWGAYGAPWGRGASSFRFGKSETRAYIYIGIQKEHNTSPEVSDRVVL